MKKIVNIAVPLSDELEQALTELSTSSGQAIPHITEDALRHYVSWRAAQLHDLQAAVAAADSGEFANEAEVKALFARHGA